MNLPTVHECIPTQHYKILNKIAIILLKWRGWKITGTLPKNKKFIIAMAPHTSNWDFFVGIGAMFSLQLKLSFLGKNSIFRWPFKSLLRQIGGIPVDRSHAHGVVGQMVEIFDQSDKFILVLSPEGTRSKVTQWKTGFLHIAKKSQVPIVPVSFDFEKKEIAFLQPIQVTKDIPQELLEFKALFNDVCAKNPQLV